MRRTVAGVIVLVVLFLGSVPLHASLGTVLANYGVGATDFVLDPTRPLLYASVPASNSVLVINTNTLAVVNTISVGASPTSVAVSLDGSQLYVANSGSASAAISVVNLANFQVTNTLPAPLAPWALEVGLSNRLYVTSLAGNYATSNPGVMEIDGNTGSFLGYLNTDNAVLNYTRTSLQISPDRKTLYVADTGVSPASLAKFDITTTVATRTGLDPFGSIGGNGKDLLISHNGLFISDVVGGGNTNYDIRMIPTSNLAGNLGSFATGAYPNGLAYSLDDALAFTNNDSNVIQIYSTGTGSLLGQFTMPFTPDFGVLHMTVDQTGGHLYASFTDIFNDMPPQFEVFDVSSLPEPTSGLLVLIGVAATACRRRR